MQTTEAIVTARLDVSCLNLETEPVTQNAITKHVERMKVIASAPQAVTLPYLVILFAKEHASTKPASSMVAIVIVRLTAYSIRSETEFVINIATT